MSLWNQKTCLLAKLAADFADEADSADVVWVV